MRDIILYGLLILMITMNSYLIKTTIEQKVEINSLNNKIEEVSKLNNKLIENENIKNNAYNYLNSCILKGNQNETDIFNNINKQLFNNK